MSSPTLMNRASKWFSRTKSQGQAYAAKKKNQFVDCPFRRKQIAKLFVDELRRLGGGKDTLAGAYRVAVTDRANFHDMLLAAANEALDRDARKFLSELFLKGTPPAGVDRLHNLTQSGLGFSPEYRKGFEDALMKRLQGMTFANLKVLCQCTDCDDKYKGRCKVYTDDGVESCGQYDK